MATIDMWRWGGGHFSVILPAGPRAIMLCDVRDGDRTGASAEAGESSVKLDAGCLLGVIQSKFSIDT